ncbi:unnamed protein product [Meloidogyne enterolobii]|uniref:Uncharacterized protein n=1 Tax=Meloidogyne enterolobii TaxID=390850 RepID=A0ACB0Y506_MELEN
MLKIIIFYFCIFYFSIGEIVENSVFNCPNNGEPKRDIDSGELIQCLPGLFIIVEFYYNLKLF